jgi:hypothetical protein
MAEESIKELSEEEELQQLVKEEFGDIDEELQKLRVDHLLKMTKEERIAFIEHCKKDNKALHDRCWIYGLFRAMLILDLRNGLRDQICNEYMHGGLVKGNRTMFEDHLCNLVNNFIGRHFDEIKRINMFGMIELKNFSTFNDLDIKSRHELFDSFKIICCEFLENHL